MKAACSSSSIASSMRLTRRSIAGSASKRAISLRASMAILSAFSSMRRACAAKAARSNGRRACCSAMKCAIPAAISRAKPACRTTMANSVPSTRCRCRTRSASMRSRASRTEPPSSKRFGRNAQDRLEKIHRRVAPERAVQSLAESDPGRRRVMHGRGHKFAAAQLEEAPVTEAMARRPIEHAHRVALGHPCPQHLAGLVPVDQEDQRCADRFEKVIAASCRLRPDSGR